MGTTKTSTVIQQTITGDNFYPVWSTRGPQKTTSNATFGWDMGVILQTSVWHDYETAASPVKI